MYGWFVVSAADLVVYGWFVVSATDLVVYGWFGFGLCYDYDYGYGYVKSVDSIDNVNSVRSAGPIVASMDNVDNSAPFIPAAQPRRRITALLSTFSMLLTIGPALRTLLTLSMLSTLLT